MFHVLGMVKRIGSVCKDLTNNILMLYVIFYMYVVIL